MNKWMNDLKESISNWWNDPVVGLLNKSLVIGVVAVLCIAVTLSLAIAQDFPANKDRVLEDGTSEATLPPSVVQTQMLDPVFRINGNCSAVVIKSKKTEKKPFETLLLTAAHCVPSYAAKGEVEDDVWEGREKIMTRKYSYQLVGSNRQADLALLKLKDNKTKFPVAKIADRGIILEPGDKMFAVGFPHGVEKSLTTGLYSQTMNWSKISGKSYDDMVYVVSAGVTFGSSGGGLFIKHGKEYHLIGITSRKLRDYESFNLFSTLGNIDRFIKHRDVY